RRATPSRRCRRRTRTRSSPSSTPADPSPPPFPPVVSPAAAARRVPHHSREAHSMARIVDTVGPSSARPLRGLRASDAPGPRRPSVAPLGAGLLLAIVRLQSGAMCSAEPSAAVVPAAAEGTANPSQAVSLDEQGRLSEALPLYRIRADATLTKADRLRYAEALVRAGDVDAGRRVYDLLAQERGSVEHGDKSAIGVELCASSLLRAGFPGLPVGSLRPVHQEHPADTSAALLLLRALAAAGDVDGARHLITEIDANRASFTPAERIELGRWQMLTGDGTAKAGIEG